MSSSFRLAVFISGSGSNLQALIDAIERKQLGKTEIGLVVVDSDRVSGIERAVKHGIPYQVVAPNQPEVLLEHLHNHQIDGIVLAGYLPVIPPMIIDTYLNKIINIHPSLIPAFSGKHYYGMNVHKAVIATGVKYSGVTIHFVNEVVDEGPIIAQRVVDVFKQDTPETLRERVLAVEHKLIVETVNAWQEGRIHWRDNTAWIE